MKKLAILLPVLLASCAGDALVDSGSAFYTGVPYGADIRQRMDISIPAHRRASLDAIVFLHGGALLRGRKSEYPRFLDAYRGKYLVATMNYRFVSSSVKVDDILDDMSDALVELKRQAGNHGVEINQVVLAGYSAGGYLALLYSYKNFEASPIPIAFCVGLSAVTDFSDIQYARFRYGIAIKDTHDVAEYFSRCTGKTITERDFPRTERGIPGYNWSAEALRHLQYISPRYYVRKGSPPAILVHDTADKTVPFSNAVAMDSALSAAGVDHVFIASADGLGHSLGQWYIPNGSRKYSPKLGKKIIANFNEYADRYLGNKTQ
jgi:acetyl esterase/lipase